MTASRQSKKRGEAIEICILAGGLSSRMGRDKSRLRIGRRTLLGEIRATAARFGVPVRVIRRDLVPRCGPLGGIYTGLKTTRAGAVLFLACDMPFVSFGLLQKIFAASAGKRPLFTRTDSAGFPLVLSPEVLPVVEKQIEAQRFSLHALARNLGAELYRPERSEEAQLVNINTPEDLAQARRTAMPQVTGLTRLKSSG